MIKHQSEPHEIWAVASSMHADVNRAIASIDGSELTLGEFIRRVKLSADQDIFELALRWGAVEAACTERKIDVLAEELRERVDAYRSQRDLFTPDDLRGWLLQHRLTEEELQLMLNHEIKLGKLADAICEDQMDKRYALNKAKLSRVELYTIEVERLCVAEELKLQVDEGADFCTLARLHSEDANTRKQCGYMGAVRLSDLPPEVECGIVGCSAGEVVGPIKSMGSYRLYLIEDVFPAVLDDVMRDELKEEMFEEWLQAQIGRARVKWNV